MLGATTGSGAIALVTATHTIAASSGISHGSSAPVPLVSVRVDAYIADARVGGADVVVVALAGIGAAARDRRVHAGVVDAGVGGADVVVVALAGIGAAARDRRVHATRLRITGVYGADVVVVAVHRGMNALVVFARVGGAGVVVVTLGGVMAAVRNRRVLATRLRITGVYGADVVVVAVHR
jgi:hypothetical protein